MTKKLLIFLYAIGDYILAVAAWAMFFSYRKFNIENYSFDWEIILSDNNFWFGIALIPLFWSFIYFLSGLYKDVYRKSRLVELWKTFTIALLGSIFLFFTLILDDFIFSYKTYYRSFSFFFLPISFQLFFGSY